jgi:hypothetical protein
MSRLAKLEAKVSAIDLLLADKVHQSPAQLSVLRKAKARHKKVIDKIKLHLKSKTHDPQVNPLQPPKAEIKIQPVSNGYIVTLPPPAKSPFGELMNEYSKGIGKAIADFDRDAMLAQLQVNAESDTPAEPVFELKADDYTFIFADFEKVLAFLSKTYIKA